MKLSGGVVLTEYYNAHYTMDIQLNSDYKGRSPKKKKRLKKGTLSPFGDPPPLNGSKGDICCLITDKSA